MKISRFAIAFERENLFFLYNTSTLSLYKISEEDYHYISEVIAGKKNTDSLSSELLDFLERKHFIDTDDERFAQDFCVKNGISETV